MEYTNCNHEVIGEGYLLCDDAHLLSGEVCSVYFGPCGIYVISDSVSFTGDKLYSYLRELFGTVHLRLFVQDLGLYDPKSFSFSACFPDDNALIEDINYWLSDRRFLYKEDTLRNFLNSLELEDAKARGYKVLDDGNVHIYRKGEFYPTSPLDSNVNYYLTLFGGMLGLHRFAQGKVLSALVYLFTGGLFFVGWALDVVLLLFGIQRDKEKRIFFPLSNRPQKLLLIPLGLIASIGLFILYRIVFIGVTTIFQNIVVQQAGSIDPAAVQSFVESFSQLLNR